MVNITNKQNCSGCSACYNKCPKQSITMFEDEKGFRYPKIDKELCINCGLCDKVCPIINSKQTQTEPKAYACYNKNEKIRLASSSGGIFTLIAQNIIEQGGVVFGAIFDSDFSVKHTYIEKVEELDKLRTSKYLQSRIEDTYKQVEEFLKENRKVLFTGTPCQIEGLISYLGKQYENLYTQDIICHGAPSPKVWKKYLEFMNKRAEGKPVQINFRQKDDGWNLYALSLKYNNNAYKINHKNDLFMKAFLKNVSLRDSCYNCSFKKKNRLSDITLADFWGIDNIAPEMNDNKGTSLVIVNSNKGNKMFEAIMKDITYKEVNFETAIKHNPSMTKSVQPHKNRNVFFENLDNIEFDELIKKYIPEDKLITKIIRKIKRIVKKIIKIFIKK